MRTDLDHLPHGKQRELARVTEILFEEFTDAMKGASSPKKKEGRILKIILFGSYARGTWVDEPHTAKGYLSDYDLLIVVNQQRVVDFATYWYRAEDRIMRETGIRTPVNFIVHTMDEVNTALSQGQYFFTDIIKEGIALYDLKGSTPFVTPQPQTAEEIFTTAQQHFDFWMPLAQHSLKLSRDSIKDQVLRDAAFLLHQAVERTYTAFLLVETNYSPATHSIKFLRSLAEQIDPELIAVWPRETKHDRRLFELLKRGYIDARYSEHYAITVEELAWLSERAEILRALVEKRALRKIEQLETRAVAGE
ncbi:MAG: nucleotidyltransferase [Alphaproteobacteria bacterium HGW-Alphaproteobacteria-18]|nr:MAG: nucleotidyltransferase [Alphaproteobacteria bacterium HGW-Alphaproteobacteria-18]